MEESSKTQKKIVERYVRYLKLERNMSPNTLEAYRNDLEKLLVYLRQQGKHVLDVELEDLQAFAAGPYSQRDTLILPLPVDRRLPRR